MGRYSFRSVCMCENNLRAFASLTVRDNSVCFSPSNYAVWTCVYYVDVAERGKYTSQLIRATPNMTFIDNGTLYVDVVMPKCHAIARM